MHNTAHQAYRIERDNYYKAPEIAILLEKKVAKPQYTKIGQILLHVYKCHAR